MLIMAILIMSAALPCIGALTAFRSAPPRTIAFWELISLSSDDDLELFVHNRFRANSICSWMYDFNLDSFDNRLQSNQRSLYVTSWFDC
jgi:hypothetical protein